MVSQHRLRAAIQRLPSALRAVVWLRYTEALSFSEIGQRLHIPPSTAKTYYYRSRSWLRVALCPWREEIAKGTSLINCPREFSLPCYWLCSRRFHTLAILAAQRRFISLMCIALWRAPFT